MRTLVRLALTAVLVGSLPVIGGCGGGKSETLYPVSGKVMHGKTALTGGQITFFPDTAKGNNSKHSPTGKIGSDGSYTLTTDGKSGAPAGWYKITVSTQTPGMGASTPGEPGKVAPLNPTQGPKIDPKYMNEMQTPLTKEVVVSGATADHYDVTVQ